MTRDFHAYGPKGNSMIVALTAYGAEIPKSFANRGDAIRWAETEGQRYGAARLVTRNGSAQRTIWTNPALLAVKVVRRAA
jgi:hypothetical protein